MRNAPRALAVVVAAIGVYFVCAVPYRANLVIDAVESRTAVARTTDRAAAASMAHDNLSDLASIERAERLDANWYLLDAANCELVGRNTDAADAYSRALLIDQRPEIYENRGLLMLKMGRIDAAVRDLATAARFRPEVLYDLEGELRSRVAAAAGVR